MNKLSAPDRARHWYHEKRYQRPWATPPSDKVCRACGERKSATDFYTLPGIGDGLKSRCKVCCIVAQKARHAKNPVPGRTRVKTWRKANRGRVIANRTIGKKYVRQATPKWLSPVQLAQLQEFYDIALARTVQTGIEHQVDHIYPLRHKHSSGLHVPWNLQVLTAEENYAKSCNMPLASQTAVNLYNAHTGGAAGGTPAE